MWNRILWCEKSQITHQIRHRLRILLLSVGSQYRSRQPSLTFKVAPLKAEKWGDFLFLKWFTVVLVAAYSRSAFHSSTTLWEKKYFLQSRENLFLFNLNGYPLVLLSWLSSFWKKYSCNNSCNPCNILKTSIKSAHNLLISREIKPVLFSLSW